MGSLTILERIFIDHNKLTGTMPTELGRVTSLVALAFSDNNLSGFIPQGVCNSLKSLVGLHVPV
jgi:hypothetical protein